MEEKDAKKKPYRIVKIEGKVTWKIEELWDGGVERSPYGSIEAAKKSEEKFARDNGFIDDLELQEVEEEQEKSLTSAFERDSRGTWTCKDTCAIEINNKEIVFSKGMAFTKGVMYMSVDVAKWLDEHSS